MRVYMAVYLLLISFAVSAGPVASYKADADAFCRLHGREQWESRSGYTAVENMDYLALKIRETIKTKEFYAIFERLSKEGYNDFYAALQPEVSKLIGEEWSCEEAKNFYAISWKKLDGGNEEQEIDVVVLKDGAFKINNDQFLLTDKQGISDAINGVAQGKKYKIFLMVPNDTSTEKLNEYLEPFRYMKVKSLAISYY